MTTAETMKAMTTATMIPDDSSTMVTNRCGYRRFRMMLATTGSGGVGDDSHAIVVGVGVGVIVVAKSIEVDVGCDRFQRGWW